MKFKVLNIYGFTIKPANNILPPVFRWRVWVRGHLPKSSKGSARSWETMDLCTKRKLSWKSWTRHTGIILMCVALKQSNTFLFYNWKEKNRLSRLELADCIIIGMHLGWRPTADFIRLWMKGWNLSLHFSVIVLRTVIESKMINCRSKLVYFLSLINFFFVFVFHPIVFLWCSQHDDPVVP